MYLSFLKFTSKILTHLCVGLTDTIQTKCIEFCNMIK